MHADLLLRLNAIARNPLPFWLKILETSSFPALPSPGFLGFTSFLCFLSATNRPGIGRSSGHRLYISVRNTKEVRCQKETPMESHRRKRHRSESSWKKRDRQGSMHFFCVSDCCPAFLSLVNYAGFRRLTGHNPRVVCKVWDCLSMVGLVPAGNQDFHSFEYMFSLFMRSKDAFLAAESTRRTPLMSCVGSHGAECRRLWRSCAALGRRFSRQTARTGLLESCVTGTSSVGFLLEKHQVLPSRRSWSRTSGRMQRSGYSGHWCTNLRCWRPWSSLPELPSWT